MATQPVTADDVRAAAVRIAGVAHRTPVVRSRTLDARAGAQVVCKCENLQRGGAFKFRGAYNAASRLSPEELSRGLAAFSSGNHAQAVALSARLLGTTAVIVMPEDAPSSKREAVLGYGAEVVSYDRFTEDREAIAEKLAAERGLVLVPPFDHPHVIAGQGTVAVELLEDEGSLDAIVAPVSGGGLAAGLAVFATEAVPGIRVVGAEPEAGDDTKRSLDAGHRVAVPPPRTIADALAGVEMPGELTFSINQRLLADVAVVTDDEIREAMRFAFERMKLVVEPGGAAGLAAVMSGKAGSGRIGVVLSGGNVDAERFTELVGTVP